MEDRRRAWLGLPIAGIALTGSLAWVAGPAAAVPAWDPPPCVAAGVPPGDPAPSWFRLRDELDRRGSVTGRTLVVGVAGDPPRRISLPVESFVAGPYGAGLLVGDDDGARSRLRLVRPDAGCAVTIGTSIDVVRSAVLTPDVAAVLEHRVDRRTRDDRGIWRRPLSDGRETPILGPPPPDAGRGVTWATDLAVARDGSLAVVACGAAACQARVLDARGALHEIDRVGPLLGLDGSTLVTYAPCAGLPCAIEAIDVADGARRRLAEAAGAAALASDGAILVHEPASAEAGSLDLVDLRSGVRRSVKVDGRLVSSGARAGLGAWLGHGHVLVELAASSEPSALAALDVRTAARIPLEEMHP